MEEVVGEMMAVEEMMAAEVGEAAVGAEIPGPHDHPRIVIQLKSSLRM